MYILINNWTRYKSLYCDGETKANQIWYFLYKLHYKSIKGTIIITVTNIIKFSVRHYIIKMRFKNFYCIYILGSLLMWNREKLHCKSQMGLQLQILQVQQEPIS